MTSLTEHCCECGAAMPDSDEGFCDPCGESMCASCCVECDHICSRCGELSVAEREGI